MIRNGDGELAFVPDSLMGDDPEGVRRGVTAALRALLDHDFDALLFAHGGADRVRRQGAVEGVRQRTRRRGLSAAVSPTFVQK